MSLGTGSIILLLVICAALLAAQPLTAPVTTAGAAPPHPAPDERSLDVRAFRLLNDRAANPVLDFVMPIVTDFKRNRYFLLAVWVLLLVFGGAKGRWAAFLLILVVGAADSIASQIIKPLVGRMRPCEVLGSVHLWYGREGWIMTPVEVVRSYKSSFSFPSNHAANITAAMLFLGLAYRRVLVPLLLIALLVAYSRVYIGVHWPLDILAGMGLGVLIGWPAHLGFVGLRSWWKRRRGSAPAVDS